MSPQRRQSDPQRRRLIVSQLLMLVSFFVAYVVGAMPCAAQSAQDDAPVSSKEERVMEDTIPKHLPIKVKMKKEKEKAFKDLKNEKWLRDFQLEVTNTGDKPIYYLALSITLPEITMPDGNHIGFSLDYGRSQLGDIETKAAPDDVPINPGETYIFSFPDIQVVSWERFKIRKKEHDPKKLILHFQILSFGDGTGFMGHTGIRLPHAPNEMSNLSVSRA